MFEKIVVRHAGELGETFDAGLLAEVILYYGEVHIVLDYRVLRDMCKAIGAPAVIRLLRSGYVRMTYTRENPVIFEVQTKYGFAYSNGIALFGDRTTSIEDEIRGELTKLEYEPKEAKRLTRELLGLIAKSKLNDGSARGVSLTEDFRSDIRQKPDLVSQARVILESTVPHPDAPQLSRFQLVEHPKGGFLIDTDLNWAHLDAIQSRLNAPAAAKLDGKSFLSHMQAGFIDLGLAARYGTEILTTDVQERLMTERVWQMTRLRQRSDEEIAVFNKSVLGDALALREAINSKLRTFDEFIDVMDKAQRFRDELRKANPDDGFLGSYTKAVRSGTWLDKLGPKSVRTGAFFFGGLAIDYATGGSLLATGTLTLFDAFVLDKLVKGWHPNTFVEKTLVPFVTPTEGTAS